MSVSTLRLYRLLLSLDPRKSPLADDSAPRLHYSTVVQDAMISII